MVSESQINCSSYPSGTTRGNRPFLHTNPYGSLQSLAISSDVKVSNLDSYFRSIRHFGIAAENLAMPALVRFFPDKPSHSSFRPVKYSSPLSDTFVSLRSSLAYRGHCSQGIIPASETRVRM